MTANKVIKKKKKIGGEGFNINFYWCNLLIHVVSMIIVRSV